MIIGKIGLRTTGASLILLLSACGGGGGGGGPISTPAPAPSPTPTPTPTPPPTNADLVQPTVDESFTNDSVSATVTKAAGGGLAIGASASNLTIAYSRANDGYTLTNSSRSQTFLPAERRPVTVDYDSYITAKTDATGTDRFEISLPGSAPILSYKYVGGAIWQFADTAGTRLTGDAATFGVETPDNATPRTGSAIYDARLMGQGYWQNDYTYLDGVGRLSANFASGSVTGQGNAIEVSTNGSVPVASGDWTMSAQLSAGSNRVTGTMSLYAGTGRNITGGVTGRFFGPGAEEFGAAYALSGTSALGTGSVIGVLLAGKLATNASLAPLTSSQSFLNLNARTERLSLASSTGTVIDSNYHATEITPIPTSIDYRASDGAYLVYTVPPGQTARSLLFTAATPDAGAGDARFVGYVAASGGVSERLRLYRPSGLNAELALSYLSFGNYSRSEPSTTAGKTTVSNSWFTYGVPSSGFAIPASGTATYRGVLHGTANDGLIGSKTQVVEGTSLFAFDFGAATLSGNFQPVLVSDTGARTVLGTWALANPQLFLRGIQQPTFLATVQPTGAGGLSLQGYFFGPAATELGGTFNGNYMPIGGFGNSGIMVGAFAAKKDP